MEFCVWTAFLTTGDFNPTKEKCIRNLTQISLTKMPPRTAAFDKTTNEIDIE